MQPDGHPTGQGPAATDPPGDPFAANEVRLWPRQWLVVLISLLALFYLIPALWERIEPLGLRPDYRVPYRLGNDYWIYSRYCRQVCTQQKTLVVGDSVVWGHYVGRQQTLSHYLNEMVGRQQFVNLGVDGIHPVALSGLIEFYGGEIRAKDVILNCNLLWMSSKRADLQEESEASLNHPELVPQFFPRIPCYREPVSSRLGIVIGRHVTFFSWVKHLQIAYFDNSDLRHWTRDHPYANPAGAVTLQLPSPDEPPSPEPVAKPWTEQGIVPRSFPWVDLETSLQWRFFRRCVEILRARGNRVFVLVGPFNEHMLTPESLEVYRSRQREVEAWLQQHQVAYAMPPALPSRYYADASHPLAEGYRQLAEQLFEDPAFVDFRSAGAYAKRD
jgi:hypothetical protein